MIARLSAVFLVACTAVPAAAHAQDEAAVLLADQQHRTTVGLAGLGGMAAWSTASLVGGIVGVTQSEPGSQQAWFHQLNAAWGGVNLSIFGVGLVATGITSQTPFADRDALLKNGRTLATIYGVNAGLDVAYMTAGAIFTVLGRSGEAPRLAGYGPALLIQGGALFVFDLVMMAFHLRRNALLPAGAEAAISVVPGGLYFRF